MTLPENAIAVVGMGLRFPGAQSPETYWANLHSGVRSIHDYSKEELIAAGVSESEVDAPNYVRSGAPIEDVDLFDADFFGFSPKEAAIMDPQHRKFLECCWEALEDSTHPPSRFLGPIGVFGGCGMNSYFIYNLLKNPSLRDSVGMFLLRHTGNDKDFLSTRVSYCFNLRGPSLSIQTACSTSLVAIHTAMQSLLSGECDMALAGGSTIELPHRVGYHYRDGEVLSPNGHCRAFDSHSEGTVFGSGAGAVALRRLEDAIADGDRIYSVIRGSAINNDGASKAGYLAPSVDQQAAAAAEAIAIADVKAETIGYVAAHGTGTPIGDPIEIAALSQAFRETTNKTQFCAIGSVKPNIGHLDTAAGVASFISASLAVYHGEVPPSVDFESPNPSIDFENSPFFVSDSKLAWPVMNSPRRAMVNSLGVGGTNANLILEQPPITTPSEPSQRNRHLVTVSAKSLRSLNNQCDRLADHLSSHRNVPLADVSYTLQAGREAMSYRRIFVANDSDRAIELLRTKDTNHVFTHTADPKLAATVFMFPGGGAQYVSMGKGLYETESVFREVIDQGCEALQSLIACDLRKWVFAESDHAAQAKKQLERPSVQLPAIFLWEVAAAKLWMSYGVEPTAMIGHSMGENTAAYLAGVLSFEDALRLVVLRGQLLERVPAGSMITVQTSADSLAAILDPRLDIAVINGPSMCVVSGPDEAIAEFAQHMEKQEIDTKRIPIRIAAHSRLLDPVLSEFNAFLRSVTLSRPQIPFVSNRTGTWISDSEAICPDYWTEQLRHTVRFSDCIETVADDTRNCFLEVGPGKILGALVKQHPKVVLSRTVLSSLRHADESIDDANYFLQTLGRLWAAGLPVELTDLWKGERRQRVTLPTYAFQQDRYWVEPTEETNNTSKPSRPAIVKQSDIKKWFLTSRWREAAERLPKKSNAKNWLVFADDAGIGDAMAASLRDKSVPVTVVRVGDVFRQISANEFQVVPELGRDSYAKLFDSLMQQNCLPNRIAFLWPVTASDSHRPGSTFLLRTQEQGVVGLTFVIQTLCEAIGDAECSIMTVTNGMQSVVEEPIPFPEKASVLGPVCVSPREYPNLQTLAIDVVLPKSESEAKTLARTLLDQIEVGGGGEVLAIRNDRLYRSTLETIAPSPKDRDSNLLRKHGTYLITGGFGGIGRTIAELLASKYQANLVLVSRTPVDLGASGSRARWIEKLESFGAKVFVATADVANFVDMKSSVVAAKKSFGAIHGVFHAAGEMNDQLIASVSTESIQQSLAAKVHGTLLLDEILAHERLDFFAMCSSSSTYLAPAGQSSYVGANCFLNAFAKAKSKSSRKTRILAINWGVWKEIGMGAAAHDRLTGTHRAEVGEPAGHPLFESILTHSANGEVIYRTTRSAEDDWVLDEHRTFTDQAILPGTAYLELVVVAAREQLKCDSVCISNMNFLVPCIDSESGPVEIEVRLSPVGEGYSFEVQSRNSSQHQWTSNAIGDVTKGIAVREQERVASLPRSAAMTLADTDADTVADQRSDLNNPRVPSSATRETRQSKFLHFGPRWNCYQRIGYENDHAVASLRLDHRFCDDLKTHPLHPALLDMATGFGLPLSPHYSDESGLFVPFGYARVTVHANLRPNLHARIRLSEGIEPTPTSVSLDIKVCDSDGNLLIEVNRLQMQAVESEQFGAMAEPQMSASTTRSLSEAEKLFSQSYENGIEPAEGQRAFELALSILDASQVTISPIDLIDLHERLDEQIESQLDHSIRFARPTLGSGYREPRTRTEKQLAKIWEELLGIDQIGTDDDFLELGGHSLLAVRLFSKIRKEQGVDLPLSTLFEARTIEKLAALIDQRNQTVHGTDPQVSLVNPYRYLVPLHVPTETDKLPLFIVAGMFGNVLNLRYLATRLGADQPVYGIQSKGLMGEDEPHRRFEAMASDYIEEIQKVQPSGPYFLTGFSGGGIAAYEMAHQFIHAKEKIGFLGFLDTPAVWRPELTILDKLKIHFDLLIRNRTRYLRVLRSERARWDLEKAQLVAKEPTNRSEKQGAQFRSAIVGDAFMEAHKHYQTPLYEGHVHLFRPPLRISHRLPGGKAVSFDRQFQEKCNHWTPFILGGIEVHEVAGDHDSMMLEPHVRTLAKKFRECLDAAQAEHGSELIKNKS